MVLHGEFHVTFPTPRRRFDLFDMQLRARQWGVPGWRLRSNVRASSVRSAAIRRRAREPTSAAHSDTSQLLANGPHEFLGDGQFMHAPPAPSSRFRWPRCRQQVFDLAHHIARGALGRRRQCCAKVEIGAADAEQNPAGRPSKKGLRQCQQITRCQIVRHRMAAKAGLDDRQGDRCGLCGIAASTKITSSKPVISSA